MNIHADKTQRNKSQSVVNTVSQNQSRGESTLQFADNRPEATVQKKLREMANNSTQVKRLRTFQEIANSHSSQAKQASQLWAMNDGYSALQLIQNKERRNVLHPDKAIAKIVQRMKINLKSLEDDKLKEIESSELKKIHVPEFEEAKRLKMIKNLEDAYRVYNSSKDVFAVEEISQLLNHFRKKLYGENQEVMAREIVRIYSDLVKMPRDLSLPSFQEHIKIQKGNTFNEVHERSPKTTGEIQKFLSEMRELQRIRQGDSPDPKRKLDMLKALNLEFSKTHVFPRSLKRPLTNKVLKENTETHGLYTVGKDRTVLVSSHGAADGSDVYSWETTSDLNYKYGLIDATTAKLVAGHLLPALLGGLAIDKNLTPITNQNNGHLSSNIEKYAKDKVWGGNWCIIYTVEYTFDRQAVDPPLEEDIKNLIPSSGKITVDTLYWIGIGDEENWTQYRKSGNPEEFPITIDLDLAAMAKGVKRPDMDRSKLKGN